DRDYAASIKLITAIRAPVEQILSHYFQGAPTWVSSWLGKPIAELTASELRNDIVRGVDFYLEAPERTQIELASSATKDNHGYVKFAWLVRNYLAWFDEELCSVVPAQILAGRHQDGWQIADNVLVLKFERLADTEAVIGTYVQRPQFKLLRENVGADKDYGRLYREVSEALRLPRRVVASLCESKYVRH